MIRGVLSALCTRIPPAYFKLPSTTKPAGFITKSLTTPQNAGFTSLVPAAVPVGTTQLISKFTNNVLLKSESVSTEQIRTVIKFSLRKAKRKSVKAVWSRFFRLNWLLTKEYSTQPSEYLVPHLLYCFWCLLCCRRPGSVRGIWIRTRAGRHKKLWKKSAARRNSLLHHVFCNATQSRLLDKMVNRFWRKPRFYINDPYGPYQKRDNFYITRTKPWRPEGVDYE